MNLLGFIFCILTVLSLGAVLSVEKQVGAYRLRSTCMGHIQASRRILDQITTEYYKSLKHTSRPDEEGKREKSKNPASKHKEDVPLPSPINSLCARLDLYPLIEQGLHKEPLLYEIVAKLFRIFYGEQLFEKKSRAEYKFLDAFLKELQCKDFSDLEEISFKDPKYQMIYYKMLKGTKKNDLLKGIGYPSLLDYIKVETAGSKICLYHAHPNLLSVFFTVKGAAKIYSAMHTPNSPPLTQEDIERISLEVCSPLLDSEIFNLFEIGQGRHALGREDTFIGKDDASDISLRKVVPVHKSPI